jgi:bifunctional oligoribonuclease and PAP phosphatase NrnA
MFNAETVKKLSSYISQNQTWVIIPHLNPDGDAMGSALAFNQLLNDKQVNSTVVVPDNAPSFLDFLPGMNRVINAKKSMGEAEKIIKQATVILMVDFNDFTRCGDLKNFVADSKAMKIVIDHHPNPSISSTDAMLFSFPVLSSTCELSLLLIEEMGLLNNITTDIATALMTGMITDTGAFSYNSSDPGFFHNLAKLLERGADKDFVIDAVYDQQSPDRMRLLGYMLSEKMEVFPDARTAIMSLNWSEMHRFNFRKGDSEGFVNMPLSIKGIDFSVFISVRDDKTKLSLRSKGKFPANAIAANYFEGGGHLNAAGGSSDRSVEDTVRYFKSLLPEIEKIMKDLS